MLEFWAAIYNELNRESQYFEVLIKLFDANFNSGSFQKAMRGAGTAGGHRRLRLSESAAGGKAARACRRSIFAIELLGAWPSPPP